jgi:hypothetical protein
MEESGLSDERNELRSGHLAKKDGNPGNGLIPPGQEAIK